MCTLKENHCRILASLNRMHADFTLSKVFFNFYQGLIVYGYALL